MSKLHEKWHRHYLERCIVIGSMSKDPSIKVGAILTTDDWPPVQISDGFNGFPRGIYDLPARLNVRETKYKLVVHAERNAILNAARRGAPTNNSTLYVVAKDAALGYIYGQWCCSACVIEVIQAGVRRIVWPRGAAPKRWEEDNVLAYALLREAKIETIELDLTASPE